MHTRQLTSVLLILLISAASATHADSSATPHVLVRGVYALDAEYDRGYRVSTYLPHTSLVYPIAGKTGKISNFDAQLVLTQFGQRVYVPKSEIAGQFKQIYGNQELIFHADATLCPLDDPDCDHDSSMPVSRGDVAKIQAENLDGYVKLRLFKVPLRDGLIKISTLQALLAHGRVTDARKPYPGYEKLSHTQVSSLSTECGVKRTKVSRQKLKAEIGGEAGATSILRALFGVHGYARASAGAETSWSLAEEFGSDRHAYQVSVLKIRDLRTARTLTYFIGAKYACVRAGFQRQKVFVEELTLFDGAGILQGLFDFRQLYGWRGVPDASSEPYRIFSLNGRRPYFTSINSHGEYWRVFKTFYDELQSVEIAAIVIGEFNASCPRRRQADGKFIPKLCREKLRAL